MLLVPVANATATPPAVMLPWLRFRSTRLHWVVVQCCRQNNVRSREIDRLANCDGGEPVKWRWTGGSRTEVTVSVTGGLLTTLRASHDHRSTAVSRRQTGREIEATAVVATSR